MVKVVVKGWEWCRPWTKARNGHQCGCGYDLLRQRVEDNVRSLQEPKNSSWKLQLQELKSLQVDFQVNIIAAYTIMLYHLSWPSSLPIREQSKSRPFLSPAFPPIRSSTRVSHTSKSNQTSFPNPSPKSTVHCVFFEMIICLLSWLCMLRWSPLTTLA